MAKKSPVVFENYDCDKNPAGFSIEELTTIRRLTAAGQKVFMAPVEIELWEQTENLFTTREKVRLWHVGPDTVKVYLTPSDEQTYHFLVKELRAKHHDGVWKSQCAVINNRGKPILCDELKRCAASSYDRSPENREPQEISWDELEGDEAESFDTTADKVMARLGLQALIEKLESVNPRLATVFRMQQDGYDVPDIMAELNLSQRQVYDLIKKVKTIAAEVL